MKEMIFIFISIEKSRGLILTIFRIWSKNQGEIHNYFEEHPGVELIDFASKEMLNAQNDREERFKRYHLFTDWGVNKRGIGRINNFFLSAQRKLSIDRYRGKYNYGFGVYVRT